ncbi:hypothetical protein RJ53_00445 [Methanocalculus chunghsingensis]|uniref:Molybdate/tungstate import ATP-binding protein WtpC n=1 Tax=Methanocalculus chunghsingensis TaxID=156457 RepID=A0A8J7W7X8_9EURY|nr:ATP-binding cassette domain-containing protein [Methanocalculus chunghsingensis]MBR1368042.1 hypothetical protein [Methanocalculus chunghsingensis]
MIACEEVTLRLGAFSLKKVTFSVHRGSWCFIIGPSGAGKTIILEALAGLHILSEGRVVCNDRDVTDLPPEKRNMALVYQDSTLFPHMTVFKNIGYGLKVLHKTKGEIEEIVSELLLLLNISHLKERYPATLSGGEQQRVAIARALAVESKVLLLDEPFSALDPPTKKRLIQDLQLIREKENVTIIQVTHSRSEARNLADQIILLNDGELIAEGTKEEVMYHPTTKTVASFVGYENIFDCVISGRDGKKGLIRLGGNDLRIQTERLTGEKIALGIRSEDMSIKGFENGSLQNPISIDCNVDSIRKDGALIEVIGSFPGNRIHADIPSGLIQNGAVKQGDLITILIPEAAIRVLDPI